MKELRGREANIVFSDLQDVPGVGLAGVDSLVVHLVADNDACAAVLHEEAVVRGLEQGVDWDRDSPNAHHGEERRWEGWGVVQHQQYPVLPVYAQRPQGVTKPADAAGEFPVGDLVVAAVNGDLIHATGLQVPVDQNARVVPLGDLDHYESPLGYGLGTA